MRDSDWKILEVLYEKRSITQTAELLYMTQPSVTKRIKAMEEEWQIEIVKRSNRGVIFTEEGRYLVQKSYIIQDFMKEIKDHFAHKYVAKELLRIGVPNSFAKLHAIPLKRLYRCPKCTSN